MRLTSSLPTGLTVTLPTNSYDVINQCMGFMDSRQAATLLAMKLDATAPGDASKTQDLLTNILQLKSSNSSFKRTSTHRDELIPHHKTTDYALPSTTGNGRLHTH